MLRLYLAVSVLVTHLRFGRGIFGLTLLDGGLAVQCFFIISGFYMALVLNEKYNYAGSGWTFIQQRFLRLYPLYILSVGLVLALEGLATLLAAQPCGVYKSWSATPHWINPAANLYYVIVNITMLGLDSLRFVSEDPRTGQFSFSPSGPGVTYGSDYIVNAPSWTLAIEMTFYLAAPFLVRRSLAVQVYLTLACLAVRSALYWTLPTDISERWNYNFSPCVLFFFMAGSVGYQVYRRNREKLENFAKSHTWIFWAFFALMLDEKRLPLRDVYFWFFVPLAIVMVPLLFALTRKNSRDRMIGELSYPYYLVHFLVIAIYEAFLRENHNFLFGPLCAVTSLGLAGVLYRVVETRTERYREQLFQKKHPRPGIAPLLTPVEADR